MLQAGFAGKRLQEVISEYKMFARNPHLWRGEKASGIGRRKKLNCNAGSTKPQPNWREMLGPILPISIACVQLMHPGLVQSLGMNCTGKGISPASETDPDVTEGCLRTARSTAGQQALH